MENRFLFRAKQTNTGEWVEGFLVPFAEDDKHRFWQIKKTDDIEKPSISRTVRVDPSTICQCTGIKDKNGKMIFENDILICHGNPKDLTKAVFGEFYVIDAGTLEVIDRVIGWHYEVVPTDALSKCVPFCLPFPLTEEYVKRCEMEVVDNPELFGVQHGRNRNQK